MPYIISLLRKGLAISEDRIRIGNGKEGWTLGAALAEGGRVGIGRPLLDKVLKSLMHEEVSVATDSTLFLDLDTVCSQPLLHTRGLACTCFGILGRPCLDLLEPQI